MANDLSFSAQGLKAHESIVNDLLIARDEVAGTFLGESQANATGEARGIISVGIGPGLANGRVAGFMAVRVGATSMDDLERLPKRVNGIPVVAEVIQPFQLHRKCRPPRSGVSISSGSDSGKIGTLGCFAKHKESTEVFLITAAHVLDTGSHDSSVSVVVLQPGARDGGLSADAIASATPVKAPVAATLDAHFAKINDGVMIEPVLHFKNHTKRFRKPIASPVRDLRVEKLGRATNYTVGRIEQVGVDVKIAYPDNPGVILRDQFIVQGSGGIFSDDGDSGAVVFTGSNRQPVGMVIAGSSRKTVCTSMEAILGHFGMEFLYG